MPQVDEPTPELSDSDAGRKSHVFEVVDFIIDSRGGKCPKFEDGSVLSLQWDSMGQ